MSPVRVLYVIAQLGAGGTERQLLHLIERIDRSRFTAELVTFTPGGALESEFRAACRVHLLHKTAATEPVVIFSLWRLMRRLRPAIVHTCLFPANWRGALASRAARVPVLIGSVRNLGTWMNPVRRAMERRATRAADVVVVNAPAVARFMVERVTVPEARLRLISNGVDLEIFRPRRHGDADPLAWLRREGPVRVVGAVTSLSSKKRPSLLIDAAAKILSDSPSVRFVVVGEGPLRPALEARIAAEGLKGKVFLLGVRRDVPDILRSLDLLVLTSEREGCPNVVIEAMATGLPVVATAAGGTPDLVEDGVTGRLVPTDDAAGIARAILASLENPDAARRMGEAGLRRARADYAVDAMIHRTMDLYEELLAGTERERLARSPAAAPAEGRRGGGI